MRSIDGKKGEKSDESETSEKPAETAPAIEGAPIISAEKPDFSNVQIEPLFEDFVDFETFSKSDFCTVKVLACEAVPNAFYEPEQLVGKTCIAIVNLPPRPMMGIESCGMLLSAIHEESGERMLHLLTVDPHIPACAKLY